MAESNIIPEVVKVYRGLPDELMLEIMKYYVLLLFKSTVIDEKRFVILNRFKGFNNIRRTSKAVEFLVMEAFYSLNDFVFKDLSIRGGEIVHFPPALPPTCFRAFLRRVEVHVTLEDKYGAPSTITDPDAPAYLRRPTMHAITNVTELFEHCPGARTLSCLTDFSTGFCSLHHLNIHVHAKLHHDVQTGLDMFRQAGFAVQARKVTLSAWKQPPTSLEELRYPEVEALIQVASKE
ncbi:hypothetical protein FB567DRAFT_103877 [Paraphoma chrysanthemicola]|uniref:Uncharacterized protein n=1 Tax=Paraphoma chrysanthemicola TaxID=798071 RepID=A0A8K0R3M1_9PLEO|nr:hypothetical protein FB567DRAFT_103877 [Paraphoma chrysanthemicola]